MRALTVAVLIILLKSADNFVIEKKHNTEQKLLSRRLLSLQQNNTTEKHLVWNEILANAFVNKIKTIFTKQPETVDEPDILTKCVGVVIGIFEKLYWNSGKPDTDKAKVDDNGDGNVDHEISDPKGEVEVIEPKYHGRIENATELTEDACPSGLVSDGKGNCVDPKSLKYMFSVPYHCPTGYKQDWLGYCRAIF